MRLEARVRALPGNPAHAAVMAPFALVEKLPTAHALGRGLRANTYLVFLAQRLLRSVQLVSNLHH